MHSYKTKPSGRSSAGTLPVGNLERYASPTPPLDGFTLIGQASTISTSSSLSAATYRHMVARGAFG